jgi:hypothetical protein
MMNQHFPLEPYVSAHGRAQVTKILLIVACLLNLVSIFVNGLTLAFPPVTEEAAFESNVGGFLIALVVFGLIMLRVVIFIATGVVFCMWLYRCAKNVKAFGTHPNQIEYAPGWAVGSFFVPFANLVIPFRAIKEVWRNSQPATSSMFAVDPPALFTIWWIFWLLSTFARNVYIRLSDEQIDRKALTALSVGGDALTVIAGILAFFVVGEIDKRQEEASRAMAFGGSLVPPPPPNFG